MCFPGGSTKWTDLNHGACYIGVTLTAISDPNGAIKRGWRTVTISLESVDRGGSPCSGCACDFGHFSAKPWDRDSREDCRVGEVLNKMQYLWLGHKNNFGEIFNRNRNFLTIEIRDNSHDHRRRLEHRSDHHVLLHHQQRQSLYENSMKYGDITLRIVSEGMSEEDFSEPPRKRRRRTEGKTDWNSTLNPLKHSDQNINQLKVSGIILRSASSVFAAMLDSKMKEREENMIEIHAERVKDVSDLLYYIHCSDLREDVNALSVIRLAHFYQLGWLHTQITSLPHSLSTQHTFLN